MRKGILIIYSGPSGVGKGVIKEKLFLDDKKYNLIFSISATTRKPRKNEIEGQDYFFLSHDEFKKRIKNKEFAEWAKFVDNYYGTPKNFVIEKLNEGKNVFLEIEIKGVKQIKKLFPDAVTIFIVPPSIEELENRLKKRGTYNEEIIKQRVSRAKKELKYKKLFKHVVVNDEIDNAVNNLKNILEEIKK